VSDDLSVCFRYKLVALCDKLALQLKIVLNDAVVYDDDFTGAIAVGMRVFLGWTAVCGPARMADSVNAIQRGDADGFLEISQLPGSAANIQAAVFANHGDAG
jgi:hypothetical protein